MSSLTTPGRRGIAFDTNFKQAAPSLRANGSGERPPDDRLREAIQLPQQKGRIASSQGLLAMTGRESAFSRRAIARVMQISLAPSEERGRRECRVLDAPAVSRAKKKKRTRTYKVHRNHTGIPCAMVLTAPPWSPWCTGLVSHPRLRELRPAS